MAVGGNTYAAYSDEREGVNIRKYWTQNTSLQLCMLLIQHRIFLSIILFSILLWKN